eukprot:scaffold949_cov160-Skeletonema_dohrnii-CCMP3373.AAC.6
MLPSIALNSSRPLYAIDHQAISCGKRLSGTKRKISFRFGFASNDKITGAPCPNKVEEHDVVLLWSPMISGRAIINCNGQEVYNSVMRGVNMIVDVSWNMRGDHVLRIVAHASTASSKISGCRQYELFVDGVSYFNFLTVDQLKVTNCLGLSKRPVKRHSKFDKGGTNYSGGEVGRKRSDYTMSLLDQSDPGPRRMSSLANIDESETSRLSCQSDISPPLDQSDRSRGRRMNNSSQRNLNGGASLGLSKRPVQRHSMFDKGGTNYNEHPSTDRRHSSGEVVGRQRSDYTLSLDQSDRSRESRKMSFLTNIDESETSRLSNQSDISPLDQSDRSRKHGMNNSSQLDGSARSSRMGKQRTSWNIDESDRSGRSKERQKISDLSSPLDQSDRSRGQRMTKSKSTVDRRDRSSRPDRRDMRRLRSTSNLDESDRSKDSCPPPPSVNIYKPVNKNRRYNSSVLSASSEQTQKVTNSCDITSKSKVLQSYTIQDQSQQVFCDDDDDNNSVDTMKRALRTSFVNVAKSLSPPKGKVTIVYTDVQGSTLLWESCPSAMKKAQDIHDTIMRQCYSNHKGYEISTEGDSFNIAFQHPVDALAFALQAQIKLYKADWPQEILNHPDGKEDPYLKFKGLRVRFGINHGPTTNQIHRVTGRMLYAGEGVKLAKAMECLCHGGQILCTIETWKAVGGLAERYLGRPQVMDCGEHVLFDANRTRYSRRIMQVVPNELAFDFFEARGQAEDGKVKDAALVKGRLFPPLPSKKQLTTCFLNAPYTNGRVVICFVHTVGLGDDDGSEDRSHNLLKLSKNLRKQLLRSDPPGYECQEDNGCWMLAFSSVDKAVSFGLKLNESIREGGAKEHLLGDVDCDKMYKIGIVSGPFTSMGPHKTSGLADYFGPIVNRAARVASNCEAGQLCVGIPLVSGAKIAPPNFGPSVQVRLLGIKQLKGVSVDIAVYCCSKCV